MDKMRPGGTANIISFLFDPVSTVCLPTDRIRGGREQLGPGKKFFFWPPSKHERGKNLYSRSQSLTVSCRVTWVRAERVNLCSRQIVILTRKKKTHATMMGH